jgi:hypothetical protein
VLAQFVTLAGLVPSHTVPVPCVVPKPDPEIVTWVPAVPVDGDTLITLGVAGRGWTVMDVFPEIMPTVAVIVAVPAVTPVAARPPLTIETRDEFEELHATDDVTSWVLPSEKVPFAVNC